MPSPPTLTTVYDWDNLWHAYRQAAVGKRGRPAVAAFEYRLEDHLSDLQRHLRNRTYRPGGYTTFIIHEAKRRVISAAPFGDRVVHHALCRVIEPVLDRTFIKDSYANRRGKGTHRALDQVQAFCRRYTYVLQCDVRQFFPSIDHAILQATMARTIEDDGIRWLVAAILESGQGVLGDEYTMVFFPGDDLFAILRPRGLPIGNLTSQLWANVYLNPLDHFVVRELRCRAYVRYVDDLLLFAEDAATLHRWHAALVARLARLRLTLHPGAHSRLVRDGVPFLGFVVFPDRRRLKRRNPVQARRRLRRLLAEYRAGLISRSAVSASVRGWLNHARYGNTVGLRKAILREVIL